MPKATAPKEPAGPPKVYFGDHVIWFQGGSFSNPVNAFIAEDYGNGRAELTLLPNRTRDLDYQINVFHFTQRDEVEIKYIHKYGLWATKKEADELFSRLEKEACDRQTRAAEDRRRRDEASQQRTQIIKMIHDGKKTSDIVASLGVDHSYVAQLHETIKG